MDVADDILLEEGEEEHSIDNADHHSNHQFFSANGNEMHQVLTAAAGLVTLQQKQQELRELVHT